MKRVNSTLLATTLIVTALSLVLFAAPKGQNPEPQNSRKPNAETQVHEGFSPDEMYKANCTRCHAELPKVSERRTKTVLRHMQVRANLTQAEAKAVLEYMIQ